MAYPTSKTTTILQLQNLNVRNNANAPISSLYTLFANGNGETYWAETISPRILSSLRYSTLETYIRLSTLTENVYEEISTTVLYYVSSLTTTNTTLSTQIGILDTSINSSISSLRINDSTLYGEIKSLSTSFANDFYILSNSLNHTLYVNYLSTLYYGNSSLFRISSYSTFFGDLYEVTNECEAGLSSLSTALYTQNTSTYSSLLDLFNTQLQTSIVSTTDSLQSILNAIVQDGQFSTLSTVITTQLLSTSDGLYEYISTNDVFLYSGITNLNDMLQSTSVLLSSYNDEINAVAELSTNLYSTLFVWVSSYVSSSQSAQNTSTLSTFQIVAENLSTLTSTYISYSTTTYIDISTLQSTVIQTNFDITNVQFETSTLASLYITGGIYNSFLTLAPYASTVITKYQSANQLLVNNTVLSSCQNVYADVVSTFYTPKTYTPQYIFLQNSTFNGSLDFQNFRNFYIYIYGIIDGVEPYRIDYQSNALAGLNYQQGNIFLNVNTLGQTYTLNDGKLQLNLNHFGLPTTINESYNPNIGNADYITQYNYIINNNIVYTNFVNIYPRTPIMSTWVSPLSFYYGSVYVSSDPYGTNAVNDRDLYWRGEQALVQWSRVPVANVQISVDVIANGSTFSTYGPFDLNISTTIVTLPYISQTTNIDSNGNFTGGVVSTIIRSYITGQFTFHADYVVFVVVPSFMSFSMQNGLTTSNFIMGSEFIIADDDGTIPNLMNNVCYISSFELSNTSTVSQSYNDDPNYVCSNLFQPDAVSSFIGPTLDGINPDISTFLYTQFDTSLSTLQPVSSLVFQTVTDPTAPTYGSNIAGTIINVCVQQNSLYYFSSLVLTNSTLQTFQF